MFLLEFSMLLLEFEVGGVLWYEVDKYNQTLLGSVCREYNNGIVVLLLTFLLCLNDWR